LYLVSHCSIHSQNLIEVSDTYLNDISKFL
jgi:hypothetical protein